MSENDQQIFWKENFGEKYRKNNLIFDEKLKLEAWKKILKSFNNELPRSILECGSNIGRNLKTLKLLDEKLQLSLIELNKKSYDIAVENISPKFSFNGAINENNFDDDLFDLVFTCGVLIHIHPSNLLETMQEMYRLSRKYILIAEYFSREPESKIYHGEEDKLFKRDFGKFFIKNFDVKLIDYGFLWGHIYDEAGFDDITWWLFKKN